MSFHKGSLNYTFKMILKTKQTPQRLQKRLFNHTIEILCDFFAFTTIHGANHIADDFRRFNKPSIPSRFSKR